MSSITGKRGSTDSPNTNSVVKKRAKIEFDFDAKVVASSQDDLDIGLLRVQNRRLAERLCQRNRIEIDLRARIDQLEKNRLNDDTKLYVINRYWNQLNEDMRLILQRLDSDQGTPNRNGSGDMNDDSNEATMLNSTSNEETTSFMRQLANCDKEELEESLQQRVMLSTRAVSKVLQALDRMVQRNEKVMSALKGSNTDVYDDEDTDNDEPGSSSSIKSPKSPDSVSRPKMKSKRPAINLDEAVRELNADLTKDNKNLNGLVTSLHEKHHVISSKYAEVKDKLEAKETQVDELKNRIDELEFELNKSKTREQRLEDHFYEAREKLRDLNNAGISVDGSSGSVSVGSSGNGKSEITSSKVEDLKRDLEEQRELAQSRLNELDQLNNEHKEVLKLTEKYKLDLQCIPDMVIHESAEYKSLQSHFSVLFNESVQLKTQLDETKSQMINAKNLHMRQIEHMESEELAMQKRLRNECMQLEDQLAQVRKEYEMLRLEFEQTLAANEQSGPVNRETRHIINSLQNHLSQLKGENARIKKKMKEANIESTRLKAIIEENGLRVTCGGLLLPDPKVENPPPTPTQPGESKEGLKNVASIDQLHSISDASNDGTLVMNTAGDDSEEKKDIKSEVKSEPYSSPPVQLNAASASATLQIKKESPSEVDSELNIVGLSSDHSAATSAGEGAPKNPKDSEAHIRDLKVQLKKLHESNREMKILLDMFKTVDKEKRDRAQLLACEKRLKIENEDLKKAIARHQEVERRGDKRKLTDEEYQRKVTKYEDVISQLQKNVTAHKQEEEALLNEMEVTGQAFEDMQEQNIRLMQQLREKDDANFKLMSERIKSNQIHKMLKEEKDLLTENIITMQNQLEAQIQVTRKLEEKERILSTHVQNQEKEISCRQQATDFHKRKAIETSQHAADLKLHLDKYVAQIKDAQSIVADKTSAWQQESFKTHRLAEEVQMYKKKYERAKKFEIATTADEVLLEEIRELKQELTCPSCKTKRKDAVLNKCFHVFCYDCLKTRYETRQRKCPKCNQSFAANDFHRLYLA